LYEINTWVWLFELSQKYGETLTLSGIPAVEWDAIAAYRFDAVWLMGVWERSPAGIAIANQDQSLMEDFRRALPDFGPDDNVGSAYCIRNYQVDPHLGGPEGLAVARRELSSRGMKLIRTMCLTTWPSIIHGLANTQNILFWALTATSIATQPLTLRLPEMFTPAGEIHFSLLGQTSCS
jgi:hypothetical protein